ncbi:Gfo/Idh/MocA family protein [Litorilituus lipolyticus]|uniref:Gfo/Idh/MocA family oxidoreductase n=1 Tax=Litorilituus lipolyticus TaxID=2491017 RepID=A0A502L1S5_9GAMM|nr:Gfo/Idh/MocA family oxidoreductase [Litorilituus lipolyticus]TPH17154.1 Gfo/Idh/MocA family oxidoreductase [Litorilituus lipolyticus]
MITASQNKKPLKLGFIGGSIKSAVGHAHWVACQLDERWQVASGCFSRDEDTSMATGKAWHLPEEKVYHDWQQYIEHEKQHLDAVVVLTPTPHHQEVVCQLLENDVAVICEKAMAANIEQSNKIKQALDKSKGFLAVTFNYSGYPMVRDLRRHIESGTLGKLKQIQIEMPSDGFIQAEEKMCPQAWRLQDGDIPTLLLDLAVHIHHLTGFITDLKPQSINADFHHFSIFDGIVDDAYMWVNYEQDFRASMWVSKTALGHRNGLKLRIFGDQGSAEWYQEEPERLHIFNKDSSRVTYDRGNCQYQNEVRDRFKPGHPSGFIEAFANLYTDMADALEQFKAKGEHDSPYVYGWSHAHEGLALFQAANVANKERRWIDLSNFEKTQ